MKLYETSVKKPVTTILIFLGVVIMGLFSYSKLAVDLYPDIEANQLLVITYYTGASASDIETNVSRVLEDGLNTVSDLKKITSASQDNISIVTLEFEWGTNLDIATNDIRDKLELVKKSLPDEASNPIIFRITTDMIPVVMLSATADESIPALYKILDDRVANPLNRINGIGAVSVVGAPEREVSVNVDPQKLEAYQISVEQIGAAIGQENMNTPGGVFDIGNETFSLRVEGEFSASAQIRDIVVGSYQGRSVFLKDVAVVVDTLQERAQESYINGGKGAMIVIQKQSGANSVDIAEKVLAALPDLQKNLPPDIKLETMFNTSENIVNSINSLTETVLLACLFVVIVVLFFLGRWRATVIIILTIPVSLIAAFIYLMVSGNTINIISLSALSIAIGMVVDDAIVVLENITTHIERGSRPRDAAIYGTNEVAVAVVASTLTIVAVFFPLTMVSGLAGIMFKQLGWMVTIIILVSVVCALSLTPMLASKMMKQSTKKKTKFYTIVYGPIERFLNALDNAYAKILNWAVRHRMVTILMAAALFALSLLLLRQVGTEFFPATDNGQISAEIQTPIGTRTEISKDLAERIDSKIRGKYPEVELITYTVGIASEDNTFASLQSNGTNIISMRFRMTDYKTRDRNIYEISDSIRKDLLEFPEIYKSQVNPGGQSGGGMGGSSTVDVEILGHDFEVTDRVAADLLKHMKTINGLTDVRVTREDYRPEYQIEFDREKLARAGLNTATVSQYVRNRINGMVASQYREDGEEYDIIVRYNRASRESLEDIENIVVYNGQLMPDGSKVGIKIRDLGKVVERFAPPKIDRQNRERIVTVTGTVSGASLDKVVAGVNEALAKVEIPSEVGVSLGGSIEDQQESFADLLTLMILVVVLVYIVMAAQFESFNQPFIIMLSLPFAFSGVFFALWISGITLNVVSLIGAIMLVGIVVKNGIVLVDYINLNRERGESIVQSVISGGKSRLRPVLMTTATTILGMIPMAAGLGEGSELWQPMGVAIIGGLTVSTLLTLVVIPVVYASFGAGGIKRERKRIAAELKALEEENDE